MQRTLPSSKNFLRKILKYDTCETNSVGFLTVDIVLHEHHFVSLMQVLFLVDPIDEVAIQNLKSYKEKDFVDISKEDLDLG